MELFLEALYLNDIKLTCKRFGVSRKYYYKWFKRYKLSGFNLDSLLNKSRRPKSNKNSISKEKVNIIITYRNSTGYGHVLLHHLILNELNIFIHPSTIFKVLVREGFITSKVKKKNTHIKRYSADNPGDRCQMDIKYVPKKIDGKKYYQYTLIDDCSRWRYTYIYPNYGANETKDFILKVIKLVPFKIKILQTDNGTEFTNIFRHSKSGKVKKHILDKICDHYHIKHKLIPPATPQINGKVERSHRTDQMEFYNKIDWDNICYGQLQYQKKLFDQFYNTRRPHSSLKFRTPYQVLFEKLHKYVPLVA